MVGVDALGILEQLVDCDVEDPRGVVGAFDVPADPVSARGVEPASLHPPAAAVAAVAAVLLLLLLAAQNRRLLCRLHFGAEAGPRKRAYNLGCSQFTGGRRRPGCQYPGVLTRHPGWN